MTKKKIKGRADGQRGEGDEKEEVAAGLGEGANGQELLEKSCRTSAERREEQREYWRTARTERIIKNIQNPLRIKKRSRKSRLQMMLQRREEEMNKGPPRMK